jgi:hypothetical protein
MRVTLRSELRHLSGDEVAGEVADGRFAHAKQLLAEEVAQRLELIRDDPEVRPPSALLAVE